MIKFDNSYPGVEQILISDLSKEQNVENVFYNLQADKDSGLYLFSTIGGFWAGNSIWETDNLDLEKMLSMNFLTNFNIAKKFARFVKDSKYGVCGFTSAFTANHPAENKFAYGLSKSALNYLIKSLAIEGAKINLSVFGIVPFIIDTKPNRSWMPDADFSAWIKPDEIGEIVYSFFENYKTISGNILELKVRLKD